MQRVQLKLVPLIFVLSFGLLCQPMAGQDVETISAERLEELQKDVQKAFELRIRSYVLSESDWEEMKKLQTGKSPEEQQVMEEMYAILNEEFADLIPEPDLPRYQGMEEIIVLGDVFNLYSMDPAEFSVADISEMRDLRSTANRMYRNEEYDEAYPLLLHLAKRGFKDAQSRLAYILFTGTPEVRKSNLRALGWLSVAAHGDTEPIFRQLFKKYMQMIPAEALGIVEEVNDGYRDSYGHLEHMKCSTEHKYAKGLIKKTYCQFRLEAIAAACGRMNCWADKVNRPDLP